MIGAQNMFVFSDASDDWTNIGLSDYDGSVNIFFPTRLCAILLSPREQPKSFWHSDVWLWHPLRLLGDVRIAASSRW